MKISNILLKWNIIILLLITSPFIADANQQITTLEFNKNHYKLGRSLYILEDKTGNIKIDNIIRNEYDSRFIKSETDVPNYGYTSSVYWIKFEVKNPDHVSKEMYLEIGFPFLDYIELYIPDADNKIEKKTAGMQYSFDKRELKYKNFIFKINVNQGNNQYFIRVKSSSSMNLPLVLQTPGYFAENSINEYIVLGLYYGILAVMILYNLFVFFSIRDRNYIFYILYIISNLLLFMSVDGIAVQYFWPDNTWWAKITIPFFIFLNVFTIPQFCRSFLDLKEMAPIVNKILMFLMGFSLAGMVMTTIIDYSIAMLLSIITAGIGAPLCLMSGIYCVIKGYKPARFYVIAWTCFLFGGQLILLQNAGFLPFNFLTRHGIQVGSIAEVILLSFALGDRINILKEEKEKAQARTLEIQKNATENLEKKVAERTQELKEANEGLKELDKLKTNFFANISHEIRTPLTLILSPVESVLQGDYGENIDNRFFENLQRNAIRLLKLINNLLDFSKIESGLMDIKIQEADIVTFIRNYTSSVHSAAESKKIELTFASVNNRVPLFIDLDKMDKIIMNLFSNSLKFTDKGGFIKVTVEDDDTNCYIGFEDSGIGIPPDKIEIIFDRFSQADSGSTKKYEGTGIGLALVKEFVELHCGTISAKSRFIDDTPYDHGTSFIVTIPKGKDHFKNRDNVQFVKNHGMDESVTDHRFYGMREMNELIHEEENSEVKDPENINSGINILIVEDNPDMQSFLKFLLHKHYNIHLSENGEEGFKAASLLKPDLIVSDVMMPIINGYEMTKMIKKDEKLKRTPVILLTAKSEISDKIEGLEFGADDYLTKPFNSKELLTRIRMLLKTRNYETILEKRNNEIGEELKIAHLLQHKLLPHDIPLIQGYKFHPTYIPMDEVGGDFYDFKVQNNVIEIFITDVSGHGLVAAFISMIAKIALDNINNKSSSTFVMHQLNETLCRSTVNYNYMTSFFCLIDIESKIMRYSNAGHLPPIVYKNETGKFFELNAKGKPLGWFSDLQLIEEQIQLEKGDRVLFYTDGITECVNSSKELYGEDRFKEFIRANAALAPDIFSNKLINELMIFCNDDKFDDDLCLLVFDIC